MSFERRADIDGLRALAVVPVVVFHAGIPWMPGGFVGVDIFFVISGFVITLTLLKYRADEGRISIVGFYERRVRRIFPALFTVIAVSFVAGAILMTPGDYQRFAQSAVAASTFYANIHFWLGTDYFAAAASSNPLLHTWSLAVEEQFYLVYPVMLAVGLHLWGAGFKWALAVPAAVSLAACIVLTPELPTASFYLPHTRAWELLIGALLALGAVPQVGRRMREAIGWLGVGAIVLSVTLFSEDMGFPGAAALLPVLGAAAVIYSGKGGGTVLARVIGWKPIAFVGLISYSLYLWHWPIISFATYYNVAELPMWAGWICVVASVLAASVSYFAIERPAGREPRRPVIFVGGAAALAATVVAGVAISALQGWPERLPPDRLAYAQMLEREQYYALYDRGGCFLDNSQSSVDRYDTERCLVSAPGAKRVLVWGDSFAANLYPGLKEALEKRGISAAQFTATSCRPVDIKASSRRCSRLYQATAGIIDQYKPDVVLISAYWQSTLKDAGKRDLLAAIKGSIKVASAGGARVFVVGQSPVYGFPVPFVGFRDPSSVKGSATFLTANNSSAADRVVSTAADESGASFYDFRQFCRGSLCPAYVRELPLHWDFGHMTRQGSDFYTARLADEIVSALR
jgi:peptidoglycan/LPS O-acetylase OafA/YrhL